MPTPCHHNVKKVKVITKVDTLQSYETNLNRKIQKIRKNNTKLAMLNIF